MRLRHWVAIMTIGKAITMILDNGFDWYVVGGAAIFIALVLRTREREERIYKTPGD